MSQKTAIRHLILSMLIYGTIGLVRRMLPVSSAFLAMSRGFLGAGFLYLAMRIKRTRFSAAACRGSFRYLILSGMLIGLNWILLFESYQYVTVATATLCYYMAPVFVMLLSPLLLREKLRMVHMLCILLALMGMALLSGVFSFAGQVHPLGILLGLGAALLYASVILVNKKIPPMPAMEKTIIQLLFAGLSTLPYVWMRDSAPLSLTPQSICLLLLIGLIHTGIAYLLYFGAIPYLPARTVSVISYLDPLVAVLLSFTVLHEPLGITGFLGCLCILTACILVETIPATPKKGASL